MCLAIPGRVEQIEGRTGVVNFDGAIRKVDVSLLRRVRVGDYVIVHAGFAIEILDEKDAMEILELLRQLEAAE